MFSPSKINWRCPRNFLPIVFCTMLFASCDYVKTFIGTGVEQDTTAYTGEVIRYYDDSKMKSKIEYVEGKRNGITKNYNKEGKLVSVLVYKNNMKNGECRNYYPDGKIHSKVIYKNDIKNGLTTWFYKNGKIYRQNPFSNGMLDGAQKKYHQNGKLMSEQTYINNWACADLVEYAYDGKKKTKNPEIVVKQIDQSLMSGKYILKISLSDGSGNVAFYFGKLDENGCLNHLLYPVKTENGVGTEVIEIPRGSFFMEKINIVAVKTTRYKNKLIVQKTLNLAVDNK